MDTHRWRHRVDGGVFCRRLGARKLINLWGIPDLRFIRLHPTSSDRRVHHVSRSARARGLPPIAAPRQSGQLDRFRRQPGPCDPRRQSCERFARRGLFSRVACLRCRDRIGLARGKSTRSLLEFHTGYKRNVMAPDELLYAVHLPKRFANHRQYCARWVLAARWLSRRLRWLRQRISKGTK